MKTRIMIRLRDVLLKKNFFSLWSSQIISEFGDRLNQMALIALVYSKSPGSVMAMAKILFFTVIPVFIIGPFAGVYVDRWDRKRVMVIADLFRGILILTVPVFIFMDMMVPVYIVVFLMFSATRFFLPSKLAFIPSIVSEEKLMVANSLSNTTRMIATILGFALAGVIVKLVGYIWGFYLDSISYCISAILIGLIRPVKREKDYTIKRDLEETGKIIEGSIRKNVWQEILEGFRYMAKKDKMKVVTSVLFIVMAGTGSIFCVLIVFVQKAFGSVTEALGMLGVFLGVGLFCGTVLFGKFGQKLNRLKTIFVSFSLCGVFISIFAVYVSNAPVFFVSGLLIMLLGISAAPIFTCTQTLIHTMVPDKVRGRVFSSIEAVMHFAFLVFMMFTALVSGYLSNLTVLLVSAGLFVLTGLSGLVVVRVENI